MTIEPRTDMSGSATVVKTHEPISFPVLTYSDALPRDDLRAIVNNAPPQKQYNFFPQPGIREGKGPSPSNVSKFDFRLEVPPDEAIPTTRKKHNRSPLGQNSIGVAIGSPRLANPSAARFRTSISTHRPPKASKWKKIGGLFKAKNAIQAGAQRPASVHSKKAGGNRASSKQLQKKASTTKLNNTQATANRDASKRGSTRPPKVSLPKKPKEYAPDEGPLLQSPLLQVEIPDTQMERYSIMFENVIPRNDNPSLLARRSKTLNSLQVPNAQQFVTSKHAPPRRRATSPARKNFSLFPTSQPAKAAKILGMHNYSKKPSPLRQSNQRDSPSQSSVDGPQSILESLLGQPSAPFESPMSNPFSDQQRINTPQSSKVLTPSSTASKDKPLPAIRGEPITIMKAASRNQISPVVQWEKDYRRENRHRNPKDQSLTLPAPPPPIKDSASSSTSSLPIAEISTGPFFRTMSAELVTIGLSPNKSTSNTKVPEKDTNKQIPSISFSRSLSVRAEQMAVARSLSVRGAKKVVVPIGARADHIGDERFVERRALTPQIMDSRYRRQHAMSQELLIESI